MKTLNNYIVAGALYVGDTGPEAQVGDQVRLYLNTEADPDFPESVLGTIQHPIVKVNCGNSTSYSIEYDPDDLEGAAALLRAGDIVDAVISSALDSVIEDLEAETAARIAADEALADDIAAVTVADDFHYDASISGLTGGGATNLDGLETTGLSIGTIQLVSVGSLTYFYRLVTDIYGGPMLENSPILVFPDDHNAITNAKAWQLVDCRFYRIKASALEIFDSTGDKVTIQPSIFGSNRTLTVPDVTGTAAVVPPFADLTEANTVLDSGDFWWDTTLKKLRVATA